MKTTLTIGLYLIAVTRSLAGIQQDQDLSRVTGFKLQLDAEAYFTDVSGMADPNRMIHTPIGKNVRIYRTDGFYYTGTVTEIDEGESHFKIYGTIHNVPGAKFGFAMVKGGLFAGAVIEPEQENTYVLEYSEAHKGYVLTKSNKYNKPRA